MKNVIFIVNTNYNTNKFLEIAVTFTSVPLRGTLFFPLQ